MAQQKSHNQKISNFRYSQASSVFPRSRRPRTPAKSCVFSRAASGRRRGSSRENKCAIGRTEQGRRSTSCWSSLCRCFCSRRSCSGTIWAARCAWNRRFSRGRSTDLFSRLRRIFRRLVFGKVFKMAWKVFWILFRLLNTFECTLNNLFLMLFGI